MRFTILTLFPEICQTVLESSILGRAQSKGLFTVEYIQIRDYAHDKHRQVDDYPYGGGMGMVMQAQPIYEAWEAAGGHDANAYTIYLSPQGKTFRQGTAKRLVKRQHLILLCGHYEGVDQRVLDEIVDQEISLGDFVLTGGEIAAMAVVDAVARLIPGVLKNQEAFSEESHYHGLLEYPQYTRPESWHGKTVPDILLSGHHKNICAWKRKMSILTTLHKRRGMLRHVVLTPKEQEMVQMEKERIKEVNSKMKIRKKTKNL